MMICHLRTLCAATPHPRSQFWKHFHFSGTSSGRHHYSKMKCFAVNITWAKGDRSCKTWSSRRCASWTGGSCGWLSRVVYLIWGGRRKAKEKKLNEIKRKGRNWGRKVYSHSSCPLELSLREVSLCTVAHTHSWKQLSTISVSFPLRLMGFSEAAGGDYERGACAAFLPYLPKQIPCFPNSGKRALQCWSTMHAITKHAQYVVSE